jgi:hypothetical protein
VTLLLAGLAVVLLCVLLKLAFEVYESFDVLRTDVVDTRDTRVIIRDAMRAQPPPDARLSFSATARSQLRLLKQRTGRRSQHEVVEDALAMYEWVVAEYEAGRNPLPGYVRPGAHLEGLRAIRLRDGGEVTDGEANEGPDG